MRTGWLEQQRILADAPHPGSPAGRFSDWSFSGDSHPFSPAGRHCSLALPDTQSAGLDSAIEALNLAPTAKSAAYELKRLHPQVVFTSGRRSVEDQARAMAGNVAKNRKWIEQTYHTSVVSKACQKWVDNNPTKK